MHTDPTRHLPEKFRTEINTRLFEMHQLVLGLDDLSGNAALLNKLQQLASGCRNRAEEHGVLLLKTAMNELVSYLDTLQTRSTLPPDSQAHLISLLQRIEQISMNPAANQELIRLSSKEKRPFPQYTVHILSGTEALREPLAQAGYATAFNQSLDMLQQQCREHSPAAIIVDMPLEDPAVARHCFQEISQTSRRPVPVVMLADGNDLEQRLQAVQAGITRYLPQPIDSNNLIQLLNNLTHRNIASPYRVMIVESDTLLGTFFAAVLGEQGIITRNCWDPQTLLDTLAQFGPDLLLIDADMNNASGLELAAVVRQDDDHAHIPIVFLSAEPNLDKQMTALQLGGEEVLSKPVDAVQLLEFLLAHLKKARWLKRLHRDLRGTLKQLQHQEAALNAHAIVSIADAAGNIIHANEKFRDISGYSEEELLRHNHRLLKSGVHPASFYQAMWDTISRGKIWRGEICNRAKDGRLYWVESTIIPMLDDTGIPFQYFSIRTDITHIKATEEAARASEARLRRSQFYANIGSWDWDIQTDKVFWSERIGPLYFGKPAEALEATYENFLQAVHPDDRESVTWAIKACLEQLAEYHIEHRVIWPNGTVRWILERGDVVRDASGKPIRMLGIAQDITERKQLEQDLAQQKMLLALLQNALNNFVVTHNIRASADFLLDGVLSLTGSAYGFIGEILHDTSQQPYLRTHAISNIAWNEETRQFYAENAPRGMEFHNLDNLFGYVIRTGEAYIANTPAQDPHRGGLPEGHPALTAFLGVPVYYGTELVGMYGLANRPGGYDRETINFLRLFNTTYASIIQASRMAEQRQSILHDLETARLEAERANRAKSDFLSSMSHELRTPLNAILGFSQLMGLSQPPLNAENSEFVQQILKAGHHLLDLINEVLDLAKIESGRIEMHLEPLDLLQLLADCHALVDPLAHQHGLRIEIQASNLQDTRIKADATRLRQVMLNLLSNAIKYNRPQGSVTVNCEQVADHRMRIRVQDTGNGLTEEELSQIFQPFNRLGMDESGIQGTGIGLSITRQLVELMGGSIGVRSIPGTGSTFWVDIPLCAGPECITSQTTRTSEATDYTGPNRQLSHAILYIEDNPANLKLVSEILGRQPDIRLLTAHEPELGIRLAQTHLPNLILLDINLPGITGYEVLQRLHENSETAHIPVIALSANAMPGDIEHGLNSGFADYLTKPLNMHALLRAIEMQLKFN